MKIAKGFAGVMGILIAILVWGVARPCAVAAEHFDSLLQRRLGAKHFNSFI